MHRALIALLMLLPLETPGAIQIAGVEVPERVALSDGTGLTLNGAGVRSRLFVDLYVGALYLPVPVHTPAEILDNDTPRRVALTVVYPQVSRERLIRAWKAGFDRNLDPATLTRLAERIEAFNTLFDDARSGDVIHIDYRPGAGTEVRLNEHLVGVIPGADFNRAVLSIWLGRSPVSDSLKSALLGAD